MKGGVQMENKGMQAAFSAAAAVFSVYLGILSVPLILLAGAMAVDYITGIAAAYTNHMLVEPQRIKGYIQKAGLYGSCRGSPMRRLSYVYRAERNEY